MLDSKVDKQIKRYLKKVSCKVKEARTNESIHYTLIYEGRAMDIRFSEHTSEKYKTFIDIIKITEDLYRLVLNSQISYTVYSSDVITYIKAALLLGPEIFKMISCYNKKAEQAYKELAKVQNQCNRKLKHYDTEFMDQLWEVNEQLIKRNKLLINEKSTIETNFKNLQTQYNKLKESISKIREVINNFKS